MVNQLVEVLADEAEILTACLRGRKLPFDAGGLLRETLQCGVDRLLDQFPPETVKAFA